MDLWFEKILKSIGDLLGNIVDVDISFKSNLIWRVARILVKMDVGKAMLELVEIISGGFGSSKTP
jgi:hypothetical protein